MSYINSLVWPFKVQPKLFLPDRTEADFGIQNFFPASVSYLAYLVDFFWTKHVTTAELLEKETEAFLIWPCKKEQHSWFRIFGFLFYTKILEHWKNSNLLLHSHSVIDVSMSIQWIIMKWIINQLKGFFFCLTLRFES